MVLCILAVGVLLTQLDLNGKRRKTWIRGSCGRTLLDGTNLVDNPLACMRSSTGKGCCARHWNHNQKGVSVLSPAHPSSTLLPLGWDQWVVD